MRSKEKLLPVEIQLPKPEKYKPHATLLIFGKFELLPCKKSGGQIAKVLEGQICQSSQAQICKNSESQFAKLLLISNFSSKL